MEPSRRRLREIADWELALSRPLLMLVWSMAALPVLAFHLDAALLPAAVAVAVQLPFLSAAMRTHGWLARLERRSRTRWSATRARRRSVLVRAALDAIMKWSYRCSIVSGGLSIIGLVAVLVLSSLQQPAASTIALGALVALGLAVPNAIVIALSTVARAMLPSLLPSIDRPHRYVTFPELADLLERDAAAQAIRWLAPVAALLSAMVAEIPLLS